MKFSSSCLTAALVPAIAFAERTGLRASHQNTTPNDRIPQLQDSLQDLQDLQDLQARVHVSGLLRDFSSDDLTLLDKVLIQAYNIAYESEGYRLESSRSTAFVFLNGPLPSDYEEGTDSSPGASAMTSTKLGWWDYGFNCSLCSRIDDDDWCGPYNANCIEQTQTNLYAKHAGAILTLGKIHEAFQHRLCQELRASGAANFAEASDCKVTFVEVASASGGSPLLQTEDNIYEQREGMMTEMEVTMDGLLRADLNDIEMNTLEEIFMDAHAEAFAWSGYKLAEMEMNGSVSNHGALQACPIQKIPVTSSTSSHPDSEYPRETSWILWGAVLLSMSQPMPMVEGAGVEAKAAMMKGKGREFDIKDEKDSNKDDDMKVFLSHNIFESILCDRLVQSGYDVFATVSDCHVNFVYNPILDTSLVLVHEHQGGRPFVHDHHNLQHHKDTIKA